MVRLDDKNWNSRLKIIKMKTGQPIRVKSTQEVGVILEINDDLVKVYIHKRGTFRYLKSNLEEVLDWLHHYECEPYFKNMIDNINVMTSTINFTSLKYRKIKWILKKN